jgi:bacillithiol system protein YtxJ
MKGLNHWKEMNHLDDWQQALNESDSRPVFLFKHSTSCPISAKAWNEYQAFVNQVAGQDAQFWMVKVIESRPISNRIAEDLEVKHASPQAILLQKQQGVWHASHWKITQTSLKESLC